MPNDFYGLPLHPLIVQTTVVITLLAVVAVIRSRTTIVGDPR